MLSLIGSDGMCRSSQQVLQTSLDDVNVDVSVERYFCHVTKAVNVTQDLNGESVKSQS